MGDTLRFPHLLVIGAGLATRRKVKTPGFHGTIVCDASGSMSYSEEDYDRFVNEMPGGILAMYAGDNGEGVLGVVAKGGHRAMSKTIEEEVSRAGGNEVDGPALDWLAKQKGPRIWITDLGVSCGEEGLAYCRKVCQEHNIVQVETMDQAIDYLQTGRLWVI